MQVKGVKEVPIAENKVAVVLLFSSEPKEIGISMLSDGDFSKEECDALRQKVLAGQLERPTVVDLQKKAKVVHEDITKHRISRELAVLQMKIDHANEKGWRQQLFEYRNRRKTLESPVERSKLLANVPSVIPDTSEPESNIGDVMKNDVPVLQCDNTVPSCFAAVVEENLQLVYLKRSVVYELLNEPELFEEKVIGCFVRAKSDSNSRSFQLMQVKGVKEVPIAENKVEVVLLFSSEPKEIGITMLSDGDFSKEEYDALRQKVLAGQLERPTVADLQKKAKVVHEDITKHRISRELAVLQMKIDHANEKGWRQELFEYRNRKKTLESPVERSKLLANVPSVIPDTSEPESNVGDVMKNDVPILQCDNTVPSCFAAVVEENLQLVYLKRSVVYELLNEPELFEEKVIGCFVRAKSDSNSRSFQLMQVKGVKKVPIAENKVEVVLLFSSEPKEIGIRMLSDGDFSKEECDALRRKVLAGQLERPTVVDLQKKAKVVHEDITKHRIHRELSVLQMKIDRANEKGWRQELFEYRNRKKTLESPVERSKLLANVPSVIPDTFEPESNIVDVNTVPVTTEEKAQHGHASSQQDIIPCKKGKKGDESANVAKCNTSLSSEKPDHDPRREIWCVLGPQGLKFKSTLSFMKQLSENPNASEFKVWKEDQQEEDAISLLEAINIAFPNE